MKKNKDILCFWLLAYGFFHAYFQRKKEGNQNPFLFFFMGGYLLSLILFAYWGIPRSGFPHTANWAGFNQARSASKPVKNSQNFSTEPV